MGKEPFRPHHFKSSGESLVEFVSHQIGEHFRARARHKKVQALSGYYGLQQEFRADIPVTLCDAITPIPEAPTIEHRAMNNAGASNWPAEQLARMKLSKIKTRPLRQEELPKPSANVYVSIRREILSDADTQPEMRVIAPRLTLKMRKGA